MLPTVRNALRVALITACIVGRAAADEAARAPAIAPVSPLHEHIIAPDSDFLTNCMALVMPILTKEKARFGKSLFTRNSEFGPILRVDFSYPDVDDARVVVRFAKPAAAAAGGSMTAAVNA